MVVRSIYFSQIRAWNASLPFHTFAFNKQESFSLFTKCALDFEFHFTGAYEELDFVIELENQVFYEIKHVP